MSICGAFIAFIYERNKTHVVRVFFYFLLNLVQLYLTERWSRKYINHVIHPSSSAEISIFSSEINFFCFIKKCRYRLHFNAWFLILFILLEPLKVVLINMVVMLVSLTKLATLGLFKIKAFWNKCYDIKITVHDITNKF